MTDSKKWWESKGIWGGLITLIAVILGFFGVQVDAETQELLINQVEALVAAGAALVGAILAIVGRFQAKKKVE